MSEKWQQLEMVVHLGQPSQKSDMLSGLSCASSGRDKPLNEFIKTRRTGDSGVLNDSFGTHTHNGSSSALQAFNRY